MPEPVAVVGAGRLGGAFVRALRAAGVQVEGPLARGERPGARSAAGGGRPDAGPGDVEPGASGTARPGGVARAARGAPDAVLLCVPDAEIGAAAAAVAGAAPLVGHVSGATPLSALAPAGGIAFGLHPLQTFTGGEGPDAFRGAGAAVAGESPEALDAAAAFAARLGMAPFAIDDGDRAAYHTAASIASNFTVTLMASAERMAAAAGLELAQTRALIAPLVRSTVERWTDLGPERALTGPVARGDEDTVARQRDAVAEHAPELLDLFDALTDRTRALAGREALA